MTALLYAILICTSKWRFVLYSHRPTMFPKLADCGHDESDLLWASYSMKDSHHATEGPRSIGTRVYKELAIIKSPYGSSKVIMVSSMTSFSHWPMVSAKTRSWTNSREKSVKIFQCIVEFHDKNIHGNKNLFSSFIHSNIHNTLPMWSSL